MPKLVHVLANPLAAGWALDFELGPTVVVVFAQGKSGWAAGCGVLTVLQAHPP